MKALEQPFQRCPTEAAFLTPPIEPFIQALDSRSIKQIQAAIIAAESIVIPCPLELGFQCAHRLPELLVTVLFNPFFGSLDWLRRWFI